jgi:hypothetical protein
MASWPSHRAGPTVAVARAASSLMPSPAIAVGTEASRRWITKAPPALDVRSEGASTHETGLHRRTDRPATQPTSPFRERLHVLGWSGRPGGG